MRIILFFITICLAACAVSKDEMKNSSYEPRPSRNEAVEKAKNYFTKVLKNPDSINLKCSHDVKRGWVRDVYDVPQFGYLILCNINSKNKFGVYTGNIVYAVLFSGANIYTVNLTKDYNHMITPWDYYGFSE